MVKKVIKYFSVALAIVAICCSIFVYMPVGVSAASGGTSAAPSYFAPIMFDLCYAVNGSGNRYYLDWPNNEFASSGYNYDSEYAFENDWFKFVNRSFIDPYGVNSYTFQASNYTYTSVNFADGTGRKFNLFAYESYIPSYRLNYESATYAPYYLFIGSGEYTFNAVVSFDLNVITKSPTQDGNDYVVSTYLCSYMYYPNEVISDDFTGFRIDLMHCIYDITVNTLRSQGILGNDQSLSDVPVYFTKLNVEVLDVELAVGYAATMPYLLCTQFPVYRNASQQPVTAINWFVSNNLTESLVSENITMDFPTNWLDWLGETIAGFFDFEIADNFSFGTLFLFVVGFLVLFYVINLFK